MSLKLSEILIPKERGFLYADAETAWEYSKGLGLTFDEAVYKFKILLEWANEHEYLVDEAKKYLALESLPKKFELRSWMFTNEFNNKVPKVFDKWSRKIKYGDKKINMSIIEKVLLG